MVAIPRDTINCDKLSKYAYVVIFMEFYPKTKNVSYDLRSCYQCKCGSTFCHDNLSVKSESDRTRKLSVSNTIDPKKM